MFMKRNSGTQVETALCLTVLVLIVGMALVAGYYLGTGAAVATAVILFLLLDGFDCLWSLFTRGLHRRIGDRLDAEDEQKMRDGSRHNPTLR